jgi:biotin carboxyl carrier protein
MEKTSEKKIIVRNKESQNMNDSNASKKGIYKTLVIQGVEYITTLTRKYENRKKWEAPNEKHIYSFIPGTVDDLYVREGDKVKKGGRMLRLEAMKMLTIIDVPVDGKIKKINVKKGDRIPKGTLMIEFE